MIYGEMRDAQRNTCVDIAVKAFAHYAYFSAYFRNDRLRSALLRSILSAEFLVNRGKAHFLTASEDGKILAVAMVRAPGCEMPAWGEYLKAGCWKAFLLGGYKNMTAWCGMDLKAEEPCRKLDGKFWFLNILTVEPAAEGRGIGSLMLKECILPYVRKCGGEGLCLYTNSKINRKFYEKNGFMQFHSQEFTHRGKTFGSWSYQIKF